MDEISSSFNIIEIDVSKCQVLVDVFVIIVDIHIYFESHCTTIDIIPDVFSLLAVPAVICQVAFGFEVFK